MSNLKALFMGKSIFFYSLPTSALLCKLKKVKLYAAMYLVTLRKLSRRIVNISGNAMFCSVTQLQKKLLRVTSP